MSEKVKQILVIFATIGVIFINWLATTGYIGGVTPEVISDKYPTFLTPSGYAFSIWGWIYLGLIIFSILQAFPANLQKFFRIRIFYITSCLVNCAWIYFWHHDQIFLSLLVILSLLTILAVINLNLERENNLFTRIVFGIYFGWVSVASVVNGAVLLKANGVNFGENAEIWLASLVIAIVSVIGIFVRHKLPNIAYPIAIAWAITAIAVKQSGKTAIVFTAGIGVIALLISALSFVITAQNRPPR